MRPETRERNTSGTLGSRGELRTVTSTNVCSWAEEKCVSEKGTAVIVALVELQPLKLSAANMQAHFVFWLNFNDKPRWKREAGTKLKHTLAFVEGSLLTCPGFVGRQDECTTVRVPVAQLLRLKPVEHGHGAHAARHRIATPVVEQPRQVELDQLPVL